jgi:uncharacterized membrane protein YtjA (UPF0391 family)
MLGLAITFVMLSLIVAGFTGVAGLATQIAWGLFTVGLVFAAFALADRKRPPAKVDEV